VAARTGFRSCGRIDGKLYLKRPISSTADDRPDLPVGRGIGQPVGVPISRDELRRRIEVCASQVVAETNQQRVIDRLTDAIWPTVSAAERDAEALEWLRTRLDERFPAVAAELKFEASGDCSAW
jgi:hypothetical protein